MIILVVNALYLLLRSRLVLVVFERNLLIIMNMSKQVSVAAAAAVNEPNKTQVINTVIMGARPYDATLADGSKLGGMIVLFKDSFPILIDGEIKTANKKWFAANVVVDALIMSVDDNVAAKAVNVFNGDFMSLRGLIAKISVFDGDDGELHYKLEF